ncbi:MAG: TRAP transporter small permease [Ruminococcaceae bacterium]|jgi:TRAP-type C4-dicarboxylate transport system permease small subunit|nr:TRAP transporter small permease [Oscillospiraceae bacterium]
MKKKITPKTILTNLDAIITGTTLTLCVILVNLNVVFRYFLKSPIKWTDEVVTSLFVWTVFMGSAYAHRKHSHLGVDIVVNLIHGKARKVIEFAVSFLTILVLVLLTYISCQYVYNLIYSRGVLKMTLTDTLRIPKWYTGIAVPLGFGLSLIYQVYFFLRDQLHLIKTKDAPEEKSENDQEGGAY